jgi:hypothetical protein
LKLLDGQMAVCRLTPGGDFPTWAFRGSGFASLTRTADEWSVVCQEELIPAGVQCEKGWRILQVAGPLDFGLTGILASTAGPLADAKVSMFAIATYDTDYVMVKVEKLSQAIAVLVGAGHQVES